MTKRYRFAERAMLSHAREVVKRRIWSAAPLDQSQTGTDNHSPNCGAHQSTRL